MPPLSRPARVLRGALAAVVAVQTAALFHVAGGGAPPAPVAIALTLAFAVPLCVALAGRRLARIRVALSVVASQALLHALFTLGAGTPASGAAHAGAAHAGHVGHVALPVLDAAVPPMLQAHALAAVVTTAALLTGAHALDAAERCLRLAIRRILDAVVLPAPAIAGPVAASSRSLLLDRLAAFGALRHRGPPAALALLP